MNQPSSSLTEKQALNPDHVNAVHAWFWYLLSLWPGSRLYRDGDDLRLKKNFKHVIMLAK